MHFHNNFSLLWTAVLHMSSVRNNQTHLEHNLCLAMGQCFPVNITVTTQSIQCNRIPEKKKTALRPLQINHVGHLTHNSNVYTMISGEGPAFLSLLTACRQVVLRK